MLATNSLAFGGMAEVVTQLAQHLPAEGVEVAVVAMDPHDRTSLRRVDSLRQAGIEVRLGDSPQTRQWVGTWAPDVISGHGAPPWLLDVASSVGGGYVDVLHVMPSLTSIIWEREAERSSRLSAMVAVSELIRRDYLARAPWFPAERLVTIPNGVDAAPLGFERAAARRALGLTDEFLFVSLSRFAFQKNPYGLVQAFDGVARERPQAHLLIAGDVPDPADLGESAYFAQTVALRDRLPTREQIHLRGPVDRPGVLLAAADAFVLDSFAEGWPMASMEALCAGLPVVMADVAGAVEQVGEGRSNRGIRVANPLGDPLVADWGRMRAALYSTQANRDELVEALVGVVDEGQEWADARDRIARESISRFSPQVCAAEHARVLRQVANRLVQDMRSGE